MPTPVSTLAKSAALGAALALVAVLAWRAIALSLWDLPASAPLYVPAIAATVVIAAAGAAGVYLLLARFSRKPRAIFLGLASALLLLSLGGPANLEQQVPGATTELKIYAAVAHALVGIPLTLAIARVDARA